MEEEEVVRSLVFAILLLRGLLLGTGVREVHHWEKAFFVFIFLDLRQI